MQDIRFSGFSERITNVKVALVISTYNWPEALKIVLQSLKQQTILPQEVLIADDGSGEETALLIKEFQKTFPVPVQHIWQEDKGFRKSAVLNKAIAAASAEYILQVDGDCILHKNFIEDHLKRAVKKTYLFGSRVNIKPEAVPSVLQNEFSGFSIAHPSIRNKTRNLRIPFLQKMYKPDSDFSPKTRGCNLSYWREDVIAINGYDETMEGWGREDSELVLRMLNNGILGKRLRYGGIVYHIHHKEKSKDKLAENSRIQQRTIEEKKTWCENGIDKYLTATS